MGETILDLVSDYASRLYNSAVKSTRAAVTGLAVGTAVLIGGCGGGDPPPPPTRLPAPLYAVAKPAMSPAERDTILNFFNTGANGAGWEYNDPIELDGNGNPILLGNSLTGTGGVEDEIRATFQRATGQGVGPVNFGLLTAPEYQVARDHNVGVQGMAAGRVNLYLTSRLNGNSQGFRGIMQRSDDLYFNTSELPRKKDAVHAGVQLLIGKETGSQTIEGLLDDLNVSFTHLPGAANSYMFGPAVSAGSPITAANKSKTRLAALADSNARALIVERARRLAGAHAGYDAAIQGHASRAFPVRVPLFIRDDEDAADIVFEVARLMSGNDPATTFTYLSGNPDTILAAVDSPAGGSAAAQFKEALWNARFNDDGTNRATTQAEMDVIDNNADCDTVDN